MAEMLVTVGWSHIIQLGIVSLLDVGAEGFLGLHHHTCRVSRTSLTKALPLW